MTRDAANRFGKNITVWIVLVLFIFILALTWICEECARITAENLIGVRNYYAPGADVTAIAQDAMLGPHQDSMMGMILGSAAGVMVVFALSLGALLSNWAYALKRGEEATRELSAAQDVANKDPLTGAKSKHAYMLSEQELDEAIAESRARDFAVVISLS